MESTESKICELAKSLESPIVKIGQDESQKINYGKPFPLVLVPADTKVNFISL